MKMGLFSKIKNLFKTDKNTEEVIKQEVVNIETKETKKIEKEEVKEVTKVSEVNNKESVKVYEKGLTKSRENFVSKLIGLTNKYNKITEEYFEESILSNCTILENLEEGKITITINHDQSLVNKYIGKMGIDIYYEVYQNETLYEDGYKSLYSVFS